MRSFEDSGLDQFEQLLRDSAPEVPRHPSHQQQLRTVLLAAMNRKQNVLRYLVVTACVAASLVLLVGFPSRIVSSDHQLKLEQELPGVGPEFRPESGEDASIGGSSLALQDGETARRRAEQYWQLATASDGRLVGSVGWNVKGKTTFFAEYEYCIHDELEIWTQPTQYPSVPADEHLESFFQQQGMLALFDALDAGRAVNLGIENRFIDGVAISFQKWGCDLPGWGWIEYWKGAASP